MQWLRQERSFRPFATRLSPERHFFLRRLEWRSQRICANDDGAYLHIVTLSPRHTFFFSSLLLPFLTVLTTIVPVVGYRTTRIVVEILYTGNAPLQDEFDYVQRQSFEEYGINEAENELLLIHLIKIASPIPLYAQSAQFHDNISTAQIWATDILFVKTTQRTSVRKKGCEESQWHNQNRAENHTLDSLRSWNLRRKIAMAISWTPNWPVSCIMQANINWKLSTDDGDSSHAQWRAKSFNYSIKRT